MDKIDTEIRFADMAEERLRRELCKALGQAKTCGKLEQQIRDLEES